MQSVSVLNDRAEKLLASLASPHETKLCLKAFRQAQNPNEIDANSAVFRAA